MVLDTLEILIEADRSGLETQLKRAGQNIANFVSDMNKQEVNWTQILSRTISPAIISGVAASFAMAITSAMQFQNSMTNVANNTSDTMGASTGAMSDAITNLALSTGQSAMDTAVAFQLFNKQLNDVSTAERATTDASQLAIAAHMSLGDVVSLLIPLFDKWGVSTIPQIDDAVTGLANAVGQGKIGLKELIDTITAGGVVLSSVTSIKDTAMTLEHLTNEGKLSKTAVLEMFNAIVTQAPDAYSQINLLATGGQGLLKVIGKDGLGQAFLDITEKIQTFGTNAGIASRVLGISTEIAKLYQQASVQAMTEAAKAADENGKHMQNLTAIEDQNTTTTQLFFKEWNRLVTLLTTTFGIPILDVLTKGLKGANDLMSSGVGQMLITGGAIGALGATGVGAGIVGAGLAIPTNLSGSEATDPMVQLNRLLSGGTLGEKFSNSQIAQIDNTFSKSNEIDKLLKVLQGGVTPNSTVSFSNNFNISNPSSSNTMTATAIAAQLYKQFQEQH